ncbi:pilus assembly protein PilP [Testudinibacter sp. TR-2022]|uniref:pilus assembly protein PilP n=1 Tax=Testudinibacter sp. TR-2022 TaxID=2585029 RepID=UPI001119D4E6|nr:pilus assembly protein PilP [Testudinibacter sp. TR-2022]TNH05935.1 hypothetical protein FHQ30_09600 [Pasteurellaceae bacterium Phil11]TNH23252.1 hypothetical protein FHQ29_05985 [Testudinibacter sp. TR-2022]TNH29138.1 hypothetical protein FHQ27_00990 [Testudinibacter sp. TR-2022]
MTKSCLTALLLACACFVGANERFNDPFSPISQTALSQLAEPITAENRLLQHTSCNINSLLLIDHFPLAQLKVIGLIHYANHSVVLWSTPDNVIIDSRLNDVIAQDQWQITAIETRRIVLQRCQTPSLQRSIPL